MSVYLDSGVDAQEGLERLSGGDGGEARLGDEAVIEEDRHIIARQEQVVGVVGRLLQPPPRRC